MYDFAVVGAGLFGSIIAKGLRRLGSKVVVFDDKRPEAGSLPAACLMKPGWFSSLGKGVYDPALEILEELYGVQEVAFTMRPSGLKVKVFWVPPSLVLDIDYKQQSVKRLDDLDAKQVIVAAGIWTEELVPEVKQKAQAGVAFLWPTRYLSDPFVKLWAPYKQIVGFNRGDGMWVGDGTTILRKNWTLSRTAQCRDRCEKSVGDQLIEPRQLFGIRPYHEMKPCYFDEIRPKLWVATGGAKNGTLAAAWCMYKLIQKFG